MNAHTLIESEEYEDEPLMNQLYDLNDFGVPEELIVMVSDGRAELWDNNGGAPRSFIQVFFPDLVRCLQDYSYNLDWYDLEKPHTWPYGDKRSTTRGRNHNLYAEQDDTGDIEFESLEEFGFKIGDPSTHGPAIEAWYNAVKKREEHESVIFSDGKDL